MKLRLDKNSLRLRLKKTDVQHLKEHHYLYEEIAFPKGVFKYGLLISQTASEVMVHLIHLQVEVIIPEKIALHWIEQEETGIYHTIPFGDNQHIDILVEKDYPCKDRPTEDNADTFSELAKKMQKD